MLANDLQRRAVRANVEGHPSRGERLVRRGLDLLITDGEHDAAGCQPDRCRTVSRLLSTLAKSAVEIKGLDPALAVMDEAMLWAACVADDELVAHLTSQRALILFRGGRFGDAEAAFGTAIAQLSTSGIDMVRLLLNRGALYVEMGQIGPARSDLGRAVEYATQIEDLAAERIALHNLGCLEFTAGDLPRSLRLMHDGVELDGDTQQGIAHLDRSRVLLAAGLPEEADAALVEAAELFRRDRCWQDLGEVDLTRAEVALLTGRDEDARRLAARARDRFRRHGNDRWRRAAELVLLHADLAAGRPAARLLPHATRLADEFAGEGFAAQTRTALLLAAELELDLNRPASADALLHTVGPIGETDPIGVRLHSRLVRAEILEHDGRLPQARRQVALGLRDLAAYQAQFGGIDLQSASAVHGRRLAEHDLDLALRSGRPGSVVAAVERSRAVSGRIRPVTPPTDERTAALLGELRRRVDSAPSAASAGAGDPAARQIAELQAELRSRSWLNSGSRAWQPPIRLRDLRAAATGDDCDLVTIFQFRGRLGAVTIPAGGTMRLIELGDGEAVRGWQRRLSADLDALANAGLPAMMTAAVARSLRHGAAELGRLLAPAFLTVGRPVVISPPSALLALPWPLLPELAGRPVTVTPSLSGWHRARESLRRRRSVDGRWSVTAVAGPGLPRARTEATAVAGIWARLAEVQDLSAATSADLLDAMTTGRVVHVAAHGVHRGENPMFSSLSMSGGPLFAYELDQRGRGPEHVVLSACDAGRSTVRAGEEALGLTSVLLQLGTAGVVAGVARVHDDAAADIMQRYHAELARGRDAAEALCLVGEQVGLPSPFVCFGAAWRA
ncbi:MAG TPA: CHAT domain-containing protein [Microlunatus sp.]